MQRILIGAMGKNIFTDTEYLFQSGQTDISNFFIYSVATQINPDKVIVLLTEEAREIQYEGKDKLKDWFAGDNMLSAELIPLDIELGANEEEAWENFSRIADAVPEGSTVSIDITNGLRSIPILMLSAIRYLQMAKNITVDQIYYAAFDTVERDHQPKPVYSLDLFNQLLDWATAVNIFVKYGKSDSLAEQLQKLDFDLDDRYLEKLVKTLQDLSDAIDLLRVEAVMNSSAQLNRLISQEKPENIPNHFLPFFTQFERINDEFKRFAMKDTRRENFTSSYITKSLDLIQWYLDRKRYAESILLAREWFLSWAMNVRNNKKIFDSEQRDPILKELNEDVNQLDNKGYRDGYHGTRWTQKQLDIWKQIRKLRNDIAHPSNDNISAKGLQANITDVIEKLGTLQKTGGN